MHAVRGWLWIFDDYILLKLSYFPVLYSTNDDDDEMMSDRAVS